MINSRGVVMAVVVGLSLGGAACKKKEAAPAATGSSGATTAASVDAAVAVSVDAAAAAAQPAGVPADLPAFATAAGADATKARDLANEALAALRNGETEPVPLAVAAVKADPGSPHARFALACVTGDDTFDLAQLTPLTTAADCAACVELVLNLRGGGGDCEWSDAVQALAAKVKATPQRAAADAIASALSSGDPAAAEPFFKAAKIAYYVECSVCEGNDGDVTKKLAGPKLLKQLTDQVKQAIAEEIGNIVVGDGFVCAKDCCDVEVGQLMHNHDFLSQICFAPGTDQVAKLSMISGG